MSKKIGMIVHFFYCGFLMFPLNCTLKDAGTIPVGAAIDSWKLEKNQEIIKNHFNSMTPEYEFGMSEVMPAEGSYAFDRSDIIVKFAKENHMRIVGHSFAWHGEIPDWLYSITDPDILKSHISGFMNAMITRYGDDVSIWNVANEALSETSTGLRDNLFSQVIGPDWLVWIFKEASIQANPASLLLYNDYDLLISSGKLENAIFEIGRIRAAGGRVDGLGEQMHVTLDYPVIEDIRQSFERIRDEGLYLHISEMDISVNSGCSFVERTPDVEQKIASRYREIAQAYAEIIPENLRLGITVWGVRNDESWLNNYHGCDEWGLLFNSDGSPSMSYVMLRDALFLK